MDAQTLWTTTYSAKIAAGAANADANTAANQAVKDFNAAMQNIYAASSTNPANLPGNGGGLFPQTPTSTNVGLM